MRFPALLTVLWCSLASPAIAQAPGLAEEPFAVELNRRSDSLGRLDAAAELKIAMAKSDWRFIGVTGYVVVAPGVEFTDPLYPKNPADMHVIEGTSDFAVGDAGMRLNQVAGAYAERYNRLLLERLRKLGRSR
jgi:hypothetical protein